ncbi:MAG: hypothetical protein V7K97_08030 [Nostoc sp.]|uniref:hypothetical protein n=1 Tax=Nostoc sp. TaxID=1180 RepID=UPI002FF718A6
MLQHNYPNERVAIVSGAGVYPDGTPTPMLGDRVSAANEGINQTNYELFLTFFLKERSPIFNSLLRPQPIFS